MLVLPTTVALVFAAPFASAQQQDPRLDAVKPSSSRTIASQYEQAAPSPFPGRELSQILGPWDLIPPDSATIIVNTGASFGWLNVVNAPLTISAAMSSSPIENGAFANAATGDVVEVTFDSGVTNGPGADLVMLEAQYDVGTYRISSDFDGFNANVLVDTAGATIVASTVYFYERNSNGPFPANVVGVEVDLSSIGVPDGSTVNSLRFFCEDSSCDPVSLAMITSGLTLSVSQLAAGNIASFDVAGANPGGLVGIAYSTSGAGPTTISSANCGLLTLDLSLPIRVLFIHPADDAGELSFSLAVPTAATGHNVNFQAVDLSSCGVSNAVASTVQ